MHLAYSTESTTAQTVLALRDSLVQLAMSQPALLHQRSVWKLCDERRAALLVRSIPAWLPQADPVLWEDALWDAGQRGHSAFVGEPVTTAQFPVRSAIYCLKGQIGAGTQAVSEVPEHAQCQLVLFERVIGVKSDKESEPTGRQGVTVGMVYWPTFDMPGPAPSLQEGAPYIRWFPALFEGDNVPGFFYPTYLALASFLKQPFISAEPTRPFSRQQSRAYERRHGRVPEVRIVALRRRETSANSPEAGSRSWSCQWLVGGHWRRRSHKWSRGEGPIYVTPHIKGPPDKEFRAPRAVVYDVCR